VEFSDIVAAVRERRIGPETAAAWLELRIQAARGSRTVHAHWTPAERDQLMTALDSLTGDEFAGLFPPSAPLGPDQGAAEQPNTTAVYPGEGQGRPDRQPVPWESQRGTSWDGYTYAAAAPDEMTDEEAASLWPPATPEEADRRAAAAAPVRVPPPYPPPRPVGVVYGPGPIPDGVYYPDDPDEAELIEERHQALFGTTTGEATAG
jgi:hypothetical protein